MCYERYSPLSIALQPCFSPSTEAFLHKLMSTFGQLRICHCFRFCPQPRFTNTISLTPRPNQINRTRIIGINPPIILRMIIKIMHLYFPRFLSILLRYFHNPRLQPPRHRMKGINPIINLQFLAGFPLIEDAIRVHTYILIKLGRITRVVYIQFMSADEDHFSVDPFLSAIANVDVLAEMETVGELLELHSRSNYIINYRIK